MPSPVRAVSARRIPLTSWDVSMLSAKYIQKGLLFAPAASSPTSTATTAATSSAARSPSIATARASRSSTPSPMVSLRWFDPAGVMISSPPRFDMYGCDFGWGEAVAARSGKANKMDGKVSLYPGREGGGSMDAELVLTPEHMAALEQDEEFWAAVSPDPPAEGKA